MGRKRMGSDPLAVVIKETAPARPEVAKVPGEDRIRRGLAAGKMFNYYEKADGGLVQKVPIYFDAAEVTELKIRAAHERRTLSALVREAVGEYLKKSKEKT